MRAPEAEYYQGVEEYFVSRRGDPLFLSNADWTLIHRWRKQGVPLRVVLRGVRDALDAHDHSLSRARKVHSLRYCEAEVEAARERWERALAEGGSGGDGPSVAEALTRLALALESALALGPRAAPLALGLAARVRETAALSSRVRDVEPALQAAESELLQALKADAPGAEADAAARADQALGPWREKMPRRVFDELRAQSVIRELLARHGLPRLSVVGL